MPDTPTPQTKPVSKPGSTGTGLQRRWHGQPLWVWYAGGGLLAGAAYFLWARRQKGASKTAAIADSAQSSGDYGSPLPGSGGLGGIIGGGGGGGVPATDVNTAPIVPSTGPGAINTKTHPWYINAAGKMIDIVTGRPAYYGPNDEPASPVVDPYTGKTGTPAPGQINWVQADGTLVGYIPGNYTYSDPNRIYTAGTNQSSYVGVA